MSVSGYFYDHGVFSLYKTKRYKHHIDPICISAYKMNWQQSNLWFFSLNLLFINDILGDKMTYRCFGKSLWTQMDYSGIRQVTLQKINTYYSVLLADTKWIHVQSIILFLFCFALRLFEKGFFGPNVLSSKCFNSYSCMFGFSEIHSENRIHIYTVYSRIGNVAAQYLIHVKILTLRYVDFWRSETIHEQRLMNGDTLTIKMSNICYSLSLCRLAIKPSTIKVSPDLLSEHISKNLIKLAFMPLSLHFLAQEFLRALFSASITSTMTNSNMIYLKKKHFRGHFITSRSFKLRRSALVSNQISVLLVKVLWLQNSNCRDTSPQVTLKQCFLSVY